MDVEYIGLVTQGSCLLDPIDLCPPAKFIYPNGFLPGKVYWGKLMYPKRKLYSIEDIHWEPVIGNDPALGLMNSIPLECNVSAEAKLRGDHFYGLTYSCAYGPLFEVFPGCCADTLRWFNANDGSFGDIDLVQPIAAMAKEQGWDFAAASHSFDIHEYDGVKHALVLVQYNCTESPSCPLPSVFLDSIICLSLEDGKTLKKTSSGKTAFSIFDEVGTLSAIPNESIYKIAYAQPGFGAFITFDLFDVAPILRPGPGPEEQWHANSLAHFVAKDGTAVLAFTQDYQNSATLVKDPFTYSAAEGGGEILQRFGTPGNGRSQNITSHFFGLDPRDGPLALIHNPFYYVKPDGTEWIVVMNNFGPETEPMSSLFQFELNLVPQDPSIELNDMVFATGYERIPFRKGPDNSGSHSHAGGGSGYPLGTKYNTTDVFLSTSEGLYVMDTSGRYKLLSEGDFFDLGVHYTP
eukprot:TRINITY_DN5754_c0_g1_i5.p1 TRINITY_DN5754_c0_g1~~TRINITY_DN5754_c0_g1_i5.p1  ORF type:complete len:507 (-),score=53.09 TRINITY_DN5754_c0_g1_i5:124-1512(-)